MLKTAPRAQDDKEYGAPAPRMTENTTEGISTRRDKPPRRPVTHENYHFRGARCAGTPLLVGSGARFPVVQRVTELHNICWITKIRRMADFADRR